MNKRIESLRKEAGLTPYYEDQSFQIQKFAELIVKECIKVAANQRNPTTLNYKPSERFVEDIKLHFGVKE